MKNEAIWSNCLPVICTIQLQTYRLRKKLLSPYASKIQVRLKGQKLFQSKKGPVGTCVPPQPSFMNNFEFDSKYSNCIKTSKQTVLGDISPFRSVTQCWSQIMYIANNQTKLILCIQSYFL